MINNTCSLNLKSFYKALGLIYLSDSLKFDNLLYISGELELAKDLVGDCCINSDLVEYNYLKIK